MLEVSDLKVSYGPVQAVDGVSFTVEDGSITAVLGANGAGKTTLLRAMTGLVRSRAGSVRYQGKELVGMAPEDIVRLGVAHVPEGRGVIQDLSVEENLRLGALWRSDRPDRRRALDEVFSIFPPLAERRRRSAYTLSGGERQMLVVGRALMARPRLLLLDEPSLGLAPMITAQIMELVASLSSNSGLTVLLVEQNARSALSIAARAVVLSLGKVAVQADASALAGDEELRHHYLGF
ncbi:MAG TPA: ABC transporter ATP-binding protein [Acidimicrobiales bacterium]|nr:ABC transporter ATP-binding protein [Acidimicrobiales bacterium]